MSRVGQAVITIPDGVEVKKDANKFLVNTVVILCCKVANVTQR